MVRQHICDPNRGHETWESACRALQKGENAETESVDGEPQGNVLPVPSDTDTSRLDPIAHSEGGDCF